MRRRESAEEPEDEVKRMVSQLWKSTRLLKHSAQQ